MKTHSTPSTRSSLHVITPQEIVDGDTEGATIDSRLEDPDGNRSRHLRDPPLFLTGPPDGNRPWNLRGTSMFLYSPLFFE